VRRTAGRRTGKDAIVSKRAVKKSEASGSRARRAAAIRAARRARVLLTRRGGQP
jgi:hypothetical protein